ncbi:hypothetical protein SAY86_011252 [Trapa natans]|nr:hypothetical protein SAY86_011252 [Trapa natans]
MILGLGINGRAMDAVRLFDEMIEAGINPNLHTFSGLLTAYSHAGLVEEGYQCFKSMSTYGLMATVDHYGMMLRLGKEEHNLQIIKLKVISSSSNLRAMQQLGAREKLQRASSSEKWRRRQRKGRMEKAKEGWVSSVS